MYSQRLSVFVKERELFEINKVTSLGCIALGKYCHFSADNTARKLYEANWLYCHGLAVAIATKYIPCISECQMRQMLVTSMQSAALQLNVTLPTLDQCKDI